MKKMSSILAEYLGGVGFEVFETLGPNGFIYYVIKTSPDWAVPRWGIPIRDVTSDTQSPIFYYQVNGCVVNFWVAGLYDTVNGVVDFGCPDVDVLDVVWWFVLVDFSRIWLEFAW